MINVIEILNDVRRTESSYKYTKEEINIAIDKAISAVKMTDYLIAKVTSDYLEDLQNEYYLGYQCGYGDAMSEINEEDK